MPAEQDVVSQYGLEYLEQIKRKEREKLSPRLAGEGFKKWLKKEKKVKLETPDHMISYLGMSLLNLIIDRTTPKTVNEITVPHHDYGSLKRK